MRFGSNIYIYIISCMHSSVFTGITPAIHSCSCFSLFEKYGWCQLDSWVFNPSHKIINYHTMQMIIHWEMGRCAKSIHHREAPNIKYGHG